MNKTIVNVAQVYGAGGQKWFSLPLVITIVERKSFPQDQEIKKITPQKTKICRNCILLYASLIVCMRKS